MILTGSPEPKLLKVLKKYNTCGFTRTSNDISISVQANKEIPKVKDIRMDLYHAGYQLIYPPIYNDKDDSKKVKIGDDLIFEKLQ